MRVRFRLPGLLALGVSCMVALSGAVGTGSAMAEEPGEQCSGANIAGQGSSLQKVAMQIWAEKLVAGKGFNESANGSACNGTQGSGGKPTVTYTPSGSGAGKTVWGAEKAGNKPNDLKKENPAESGDGFVASDEPLTPAQMKNLDEAAGGTGQTVVIPVEQAAVAVIVNPPAECDITEITNADLQKVWNGEITEWKGISTAVALDGPKVACNKPITLDVRQDSSGTTFVFKSYLAEINKGNTCAGAGPPAKTWAFYAEPAHNTEWPAKPVTGCNATVVHSAKQGGGGEAEEVEKTSGSMGYANLADARSKFTDEVGDHYHWVSVQNEIEAGDFQYPGTSGSEPSLTADESNCEGTTYTNKPTKIEADDDWSKVSGAHPGTNASYPICTLTYDIALMNYALAEVPSAASVAKTAYDYMNYVVAKKGGQSDLAGHDYHELETTVGKYAQEEALIIAEGTDLKFEAGGKEITTFDEAENLFLWEPLAGLNTLTVKNVAGLGESHGFSLLVDSGKYSLPKNNCTGELAVGASCTLEINKEEAGLLLLMWDGIDILHIL